MDDEARLSESVIAELDEVFGSLTDRERSELDLRIDRARAEADQAYEQLRAGKRGAA